MAEWPPKDAQILITRTSEYLSLHSKRNFSEVVKLRILKYGDYPVFYMIAYVFRKTGGAYSSMKYAEKKGLVVRNLYDGEKKE